MLQPSRSKSCKPEIALSQGSLRLQLIDELAEAICEHDLVACKELHSSGPVPFLVWVFTSIRNTLTSQFCQEYGNKVGTKEGRATEATGLSGKEAFRP